MTTTEELAAQLESKTICRFCLSVNSQKLQLIYTRGATTSVPLPVQVMAVASIEVFSNDGMPSWICSDCRLLFAYSYSFKQMCKRAETLLRQYPLTGQWPNELQKPRIPLDLLPPSAQATLKKAAQQSKQHQQTKQQQPQQKEQQQLQEQQQKQSTITTKTAPPPPPQPARQKPLKPQNVTGGGGGGPKKLLNSNPVSSPEPPAPVRMMKKEKLDEETNIFLNKVENDEELSIDDVQRLIAAADNETEFIDVVDAQVVQAVASASTATTTSANTTSSASKRSTNAKKPKLLNKSSIRILNKEAQLEVEPRLSLPKVKRDVDGNVAIVTEILDPSVPYEMEADPIKTAEPVETNVFPCPHCERSFPLRQLRDIHMVNHNRERSFQCPECDKSFFSKYDLQKHNLIHTGDRPFKCTVCDKDFTRATLLHRHEKTHTDIPKSICIYCEKPFISKDEMEKHMERHRKNRPYQCKICKKAFAFKQGMERHELVHSRDQPYPCQYCDLSFSTPSKLARHLTAHAGRRPYPCKFCAKSYLLSHHLTRHLRSHKQATTGEDFSCNDCDKSYKTRDELIYHSAVHATQTLTCPLCKEKFKDIKAVTAHIKDHAEGEAYACEFCDLIFMTSEQLQQHTDDEHVDDMAAYLEDDAAQAQTTTEAGKRKSTAAEAFEQEVQNLETMEEFLIDELPGDVQILENQVIQNSGIKLEMSTIGDAKPVPKKLTQISYQPKDNDEGNDDNCMLLPDDNILVTNEAIQHSAEGDNEMTEEEEEEQQQEEVEEELLEEEEEDEEFVEVSPPAKIRRVAAKTVPQSLVRVAAPAEKPKQPQVQLRRKVAVPPPPPIKIAPLFNKKSASSSSAINSVLNSLPKSVSVRRSVPAAATATVAAEATKQTPSPPPKQQRLVRIIPRRSNNSVEEEQPKQQQILNKRSPATSRQVAMVAAAAIKTSPNQGAASTNVKMKVMHGEKKVKLQKIVISKAKAAEMKKQGRILFKDGNMILKPKPTSE